MRDVLRKELEKTIKSEQRYIKKYSSDNNKAKKEILKIPEQLKANLSLAFSKSFSYIFESGIIEKSYNREELMLSHELKSYALAKKKDKKRVLAFKKDVKKGLAKNVLLSGAKGMGLGVLGIGLPDIPIFTALLIKGIYEIAIEYGYDYESTTERYYILELIITALSEPDNIAQKNNALNSHGFILPSDYKERAHAEEAANTLAMRLLAMKFIQGLPLVGVVGGAFDAIYTKRVLEYAQIKYYRRFLTEKIIDENNKITQN